MIAPLTPCFATKELPWQLCERFPQLTHRILTKRFLDIAIISETLQLQYSHGWDNTLRYILDGYMKMSMNMLRSVLLIGVLCTSQASKADMVLFTNPITGTNPNTANPYTTGQTVNPNITATGIGRGSGIGGTNANDRYNANGWNSASLDLNDYFNFTITPSFGYVINFTNFMYTGQASATGPSSFRFRSSADNYAGDIGMPTAIGTTISLTAPAYQALTSPIQFRLYGFGASGGAGTFSVNDFTFNGDVVAVPEPMSLVLCGLACGGLLTKRMLRRRRRVVADIDAMSSTAV